MKKQNKTYTRRTGHIKAKIRVVIVTEGRKTEPVYLQKLNELYSQYYFDIHPADTKNSPDFLVERMTIALTHTELEARDSAWIIHDTDNWTEQQRASVKRWAAKDERHHAGISNPNFEYWILLHVHNGAGVHSAKTLEEKLKSSIPKYTKHLDGFILTRENLTTACTRAEQRLRDNEGDFRRVPSTTMHQLINLLG